VARRLRAAGVDTGRPSSEPPAHLASWPGKPDSRHGRTSGCVEVVLGKVHVGKRSDRRTGGNRDPFASPFSFPERRKNRLTRLRADTMPWHSRTATRTVDEWEITDLRVHFLSVGSSVTGRKKVGLQGFEWVAPRSCGWSNRGNRVSEPVKGIRLRVAIKNAGKCNTARRLRVRLHGHFPPKADLPPAGTATLHRIRPLTRSRFLKPPRDV